MPDALAIHVPNTWNPIQTEELVGLLVDWSMAKHRISGLNSVHQ
jgi:hypothetical protein